MAFLLEMRFDVTITVFDLISGKFNFFHEISYIYLFFFYYIYFYIRVRIYNKGICYLFNSMASTIKLTSEIVILRHMYNS